MSAKFTQVIAKLSEPIIVMGDAMALADTLEQIRVLSSRRADFRCREQGCPRSRSTRSSFNLIPGTRRRAR